MRVIGFLLSLVITTGLVYVLDNSWVVDGNRIPPLGKFLDPFHGFWQNAEPKGFRYEDQLNIEGFGEPVIVVYDSMLIPHIFANNNADLYRAQGFITARHRLWQMEFQALAGTGRVSEVIGGTAIPFDRRQRRQGMVMGAEHALHAIEQDSITNRILLAFTAGVNEYISRLSYDDLPIEYKLIDYAPEPWTNLKSAVVIMNLNQTLSIFEKDMEMTNALKMFGRETVDLLYPDNERVANPIVNKPGGWNFNPIAIDSFPLAVPNEYVTAEPLEKPDRDTGSNNWAVSGSKTLSGSPLLCNDMHLDLNLPSLWFAIHLHAPGINCMGVTAPGGPGIVVGFNDSIAWGFTNAQRDLVDWYKITFAEGTHNKYILDGQVKDIKWRIETIKVRDDDEFIDSVMVTDWGPVVYDARFGSENDGRDYAMKWIAHDAQDEFRFLYEINRVKGYTDYLRALTYHYSPAQNVVFASVKGDIAIRVQGQFPVRRKYEGKFILDGSKTSSGWHDFIPFDQNPLLHNPPNGFVHSENQYPVDDTYPYYIESNSYEAYRNRRVYQVLNQDTLLGVQNMMALQNDNYNLRAAESLPVFLSHMTGNARTPEERQALDLLQQWNYTSDASSVASCYYEAWWNEFYVMTWDEMQNDTLALEFPSEYVTIRLLKEHPDLDFFDLRSTGSRETAKDIVIQSFHKAMEDVRAWKNEHAVDLNWANFKDTRIRHLARLEPFTRHIATGGGESIVNATKRQHGPSWRQVISLEPEGIKAWGVYPGGQSGNPGSIYYDNMIDHWAGGTYYSLTFGNIETLRAHALEQTVFNPAER